MLQYDFSEDERQLAADTLGTLALRDEIRRNPEIQKAMPGKKKLFHILCIYGMNENPTSTMYIIIYFYHQFQNVDTLKIHVSYSQVIFLNIFLML